MPQNQVACVAPRRPSPAPRDPYPGRPGRWRIARVVLMEMTHAVSSLESEPEQPRLNTHRNFTAIATSVGSESIENFAVRSSAIIESGPHRLARGHNNSSSRTRRRLIGSFQPFPHQLLLVLKLSTHANKRNEPRVFCSMDNNLRSDCRLRARTRFRVRRRSHSRCGENQLAKAVEERT